MFRRLRPASWAFDIGLALATLVCAMPTLGSATSWVADLVVAIGTSTGVAVRRASPPLALAMVAAGAVVQMAAVSVPSGVNLGQLFVVYACAAFGSPRMRRVALAAALAGGVVATAYFAVFLFATSATLPDPTLAAVTIGLTGGLMVATLACAWLLGLARHLVLRAREASVAQRIAEVEAERDRERVAVELERGRVAREMHDVLAHSLVSIAMLADGARVAARTDPDETDDLARTIGELARESVTDVRRLLAELRHGQTEGTAPTIADLPALVGRFEQLGLVIDDRVRGEPRPLTPGASLAAYRAVQESLTNALRHGDARSRVMLDREWRPGSLNVRVSNRLRAPAEQPGDEAPAGGIPVGGHGLIGIRERVLLEAGTFSAGAVGDAFVVELALPTGIDPATPVTGEQAGLAASAVPLHREARA